MAEENKSLQGSSPEDSGEVVTPRMEQLLFACGGYVIAQLIVLTFIRDPSDGDYLQLGFTGAFIGVVAHVLVRGLGLNFPGLGGRFSTRMRMPGRRSKSSADKSSGDGSRRAARYRAALAAFRRPFERRKRKSEAPGNEDRIVETDEGFRVGDRVFSRRAEAEDFLYLGDSPDGGAPEHDRSEGPAAQHRRRIRWPVPRMRNSFVITIIFVLAALFILFA